MPEVSPTPGVDLIVFDCDGVLVDSERISAEVGARVLNELGWRVTPDELIRRFAGCSEEVWRTAVEEELGRSLPHDWDASYTSWYERAYDDGLRPVPGVAEALQSIDIPRCVASNGSHKKIRANLRRTGLLAEFEGRMFSADDVPNGKPAPDLFLHAAEKMGAKAEKCVVVEDTPTGLAAARAAGMRSLAYAGGVIPVERLRSPNVTVFDDMSLLPSLIANIHQF